MIRIFTRADCPHIFGIVIAVLLCASCTSAKNADLQEAPIITSATHQHTLYNGKGQAIEARTAKKNAPTPVLTYFTSEENLLRDEGGSTEAPSTVGDYFVRVERPAGNGYKQGPNIKIEYHIQKALVTIKTEDRQEYLYDGKPKAPRASVDAPVELTFTYYQSGADTPLPAAPTERGVYRALISFPGNANYMGASREVSLVIK
ncbi:MAG: hypothetical protein LBV68_08670 [Spirochaetaceae bacterium]|jgi:hypothetical protein|nr:hypothetical protein [Spirochaetaceae bacterium]